MIPAGLTTAQVAEMAGLSPSSAASMLSQKGIKTTEEELKVLLEAAVKEMNDKFKKETAAAQSALEETHNTGFTVKPASE